MTGDSARAESRAIFLQNSSFRTAEVEALSSDASFRRYFRLVDNSRRALLMDAPPPREGIRSYVSVARHLHTLGFSAPELMDCDESQGFLIIEDFGNDTYTHLLASGEDEQSLYELAIDSLCTLHSHEQALEISLPEYNVGELIEEANLLVDWYQPYLTGNECDGDAKGRYANAWCEVISSLQEPRTALVLRDFHVDNLMRLPGRDGVAACGLLDFQDALFGASAYDVVSLLEDARRDLGSGLATTMLERYRYGMQMADEEFAHFMQWYRVLGAQRHCKVLGIFVRLLQRDGKGVYIEHLPRILGLLKAHLDSDELAPLRTWFNSDFPEFIGNS